MTEHAEPRWLLLIHQIPPSPGYLRVKTSRRLQGLGAVAVKNSVYVLPNNDQALEDFQWVRREIVTGGGDASVCQARFVEGLSDPAVEGLFNDARAGEYASLAQELRRLQAMLARAKKRSATEEVATILPRLRRRFEEVVRLDFFGAPGRDTVEALLTTLELSLRPESTVGPVTPPADVRAKTWVTRSGLFVDRIASAWLIRRFVDPEARFKFVRGEGYAAGPAEIRFDMFEAEFTHEGDQCTFEVLVRRFGLEDPALRPVAEIVHDIDLKDGRFSRPETTGIEHLIAGIAMRHKEDEERLRDGAVAFEALYEYFKRKR
jgi:hypothetical protein